MLFKQDGLPALKLITNTSNDDSSINVVTSTQFQCAETTEDSTKEKNELKL